MISNLKSDTNFVKAPQNKRSLLGQSFSGNNTPVLYPYPHIRQPGTP